MINQKQLIAEQQQIISEQEQIIHTQLTMITNHANTIRIKDILYLEAEKTLQTLLELLTKLIELRDPYTKGHSQRVSDLAMRIAQQSPNLLNPEEFVALKYGALLHDIGKIVISDFVLTKPTLLTEAEMFVIQQHTIMGSKLVAPLEFHPIVSEIVLHHHENYDGSGYPAGLKGSEIPLAARIVRVADAFEALTSNRPYRIAYSKKNAIRVMEKESSYYDPLFLASLKRLILRQPEG